MYVRQHSTNTAISLDPYLLCSVLRAGIPAEAQKVLYLFSTQAVYPDHRATLQCPTLVRRTVYSCEAKVFLSVQRSRERGQLRVHIHPLPKWLNKDHYEDRGYQKLSEGTRRSQGELGARRLAKAEWWWEPVQDPGSGETGEGKVHGWSLWENK